MEFSHVAVVLPAWKTTRPARDVLLGLKEAFEAGLRAVVVDNGSGEAAVAELHRALEDAGLDRRVTVLALPRNTGFCGGVNAGVAEALEGDPGFIWLMNSDTSATPDDLRELLAVHAETGAGVVSAPEGGPGFAGQGRWPRPFYLRPQDFLLRAPGDARWTQIGRCACWCSLFEARLVRDLIARDGAFLDPSIFLDWDEWDVSLRAASLGYRVLAALCCRASHDSAVAFGADPMAAVRQYYRSRNALIVGRRHMPGWKFWGLLPLHFARDGSYLLRLRLGRKQPHELAYVEGVFDAARGRRGKWRKHPD